MSPVKTFDLVVALTAGGPGTSSNLPTMFMYTFAFERGRLGIGSEAHPGQRHFLADIVLAHQEISDADARPVLDHILGNHAGESEVVLAIQTSAGPRTLRLDQSVRDALELIELMSQVEQAAADGDHVKDGDGDGDDELEAA